MTSQGRVHGKRGPSGGLPAVRKAAWSLAIIGLIGAALAATNLIGPESSVLAAPKSEPVDPDTLIPPFRSWPDEQPAFVLVVTGEMLGYMKPCGCSEGQHGGLARRAGFLDYLAEEKDWEALPLDMGELIGKSGPLEPLRYGYALESLKQMGYPVVGVGPNDLAISVNEILGQGLNSAPTALMNANIHHVEPDFDEFLSEGIKRLAVMKVGGKTVGVGVLTDDDPDERLPDPSVRIADTQTTAAELLAKLEAAKVDLKVMLVHIPEAEAKELAKTVPGYDLIVCSSRLEDAADEDAEWVGDTMVTWVGRKGKAVGVVGYWPGAKPRLRFEVVALDARFPEKEGMNEIYDQFVSAIKAEKFLSRVPKLPLPEGQAYVGAETCGDCHTKAYEHWLGTGHAHALETLADARPTNTQNYNTECVGCHVVGLGFQTGFKTPETTPELAGVQCENCHGPGQMHVDDPDDAAARASVRVTLEESRHHATKSCVVCHDAENSLHFDFDSYWEQVKHPWRD